MAVNINGDTGIDKVQPGSVDGVDLTDGSVTEAKIGTGAVTSAKLANDISVPGTVTATSFVGSGASLTGIAGGFSNMEVFTTSGTWTNPGNVQKVKVTVIGGGGGGGGGAATARTGATGGGGGGAAIEIISFPSATNVPVTIGGAGGAGTATNSTSGNNGGSGGTSSFGAYCSASGGGAGLGAYANSTIRVGGAGGSGSGGTININGRRGRMSNQFSDDYNNYALGGAEGGGSLLGDGGDPAGFFGYIPTQTPASPSGIYGTGGGGGSVQSPSPGSRMPGGGGVAGVVIVEY